jgi:hypothetical protein
MIQIVLRGVPLRSRRSQVRLLRGAPGISGVLSDDAEIHDNAVTAARALLEAVAAGAPDAIERARELAEADIEARGGGLALQVLSGDAFALARAVELARIVLEQFRPSRRPTKPPRVSATRKAMEARDDRRAAQ